MFFPVRSYGISITLLQVLISLRFLFHPFKGINWWCSRKRLFKLLEALIRRCFEKLTARDISAYFAYFPAKHPG